MGPKGIHNIVGENIRLFRTALRMTQEELGAHLHVRNEHISRIENGSREPSLQLLEKLSEILKHDVSEFFIKHTDTLLICIFSIKISLAFLLGGGTNVEQNTRPYTPAPTPSPGRV